VCCDCGEGVEGGPRGGIASRGGWELVELSEPDVAHGDFAGLAFNLESDEARLVVD
jgi:hypothetical protein